LRVEQASDVPETRRTIEQVLHAVSGVSSEAGVITAPMANADLVTDLLVALRAKGIRLAEMSVQKPTLDEVFLTITGEGAKNNEEASA
jgi:hypothetical protein